MSADESAATRAGSPSPFHRGEQQLQALYGVRATMEPWGREVIRDRLPQRHRQFYEQLPFVVVASRDGAGQPWVTLLGDRPGFARAIGARALLLDTRPQSDDPLAAALVAGADVGLLGIDLATRRRNRLNGRLQRAEGGALVVGVEQAFGNCPQHISARAWRRVATSPGKARRSRRLSAAAQRAIRAADTLFIGSGYRGRGEHAAFGMDASHRGGPPGFVQVLDDQQLVIPDYAGNNHFNTVGNLLLDPRAALLFVDFETGDLLHLTGRVTVDVEPDAVARYHGAQRLLRFDVIEVRERPSALRLRWSKVTAALRLQVAAKARESAEVVSLYLQPTAGALPTFAAGQHLPIYAPVSADGAVELRHYSLSAGPTEGDGRLRISVKRVADGRVSRWLHDEVKVGDVLVAEPPSGDFVLREGDRPVVLLSAGIGLTPVVSMLHELARDAARGRDVRFVHVARDGAHDPLRSEIDELVASMRRARLHVAYSQPRAEDVLGRDYHSAGRLDAAQLDAVIGEVADTSYAGDADFYVCGPAAFMADVLDWLARRGVPAQRVHHESFGPVNLSHG